MAKTVCKAWKRGLVKRRGQASLEFHKDGKPQYYCQGYIDQMTEDLLPVCQACPDHVYHAQEDMDRI